MGKLCQPDPYGCSGFVGRRRSKTESVEHPQDRTPAWYNNKKLFKTIFFQFSLEHLGQFIIILFANVLALIKNVFWTI